jgi:UPF0042 nucleotide-binding protein
MRGPGVIDRPHLVVITGMSGAGRSTAAKALEDIGYFVVDNLPAPLISGVVDHADLQQSRRGRLAVIVDTRGGLSFVDLERVLLSLARNAVPTTLLFLEAGDDVLLSRFNESRRPHPVEAPSVAESIALEREALQGLRDRADVVVDSSGRTVHDLREQVQEAFAGVTPRRSMRVAVTSFGFKHGVPPNVDLVFDVRFLPNPHWSAELRPLTGRDEAVREFVFSHDDAVEFVARIEDLLAFLLPRYEAEGKAYLTVAVGCTGGRHRSVAVVERLGEWIRSRDLPVTVNHRDIDR